MAQSSDDLRLSQASRRDAARQYGSDTDFTVRSDGERSTRPYMQRVQDFSDASRLEGMSQDADAETARVQRRQPTRVVKRTPPKAAAKRK